MILIFCLTVCLLPSTAVESTAATPSIEEILNNYHSNAHESRIAEAQGTISMYSRRTPNVSKTLEQETVDTLNKAGCEAYNVTSENYEELGESLQTDFSAMGLDPNGSYIVAISGEEQSDSGPSASPFAIDPPVYDHIGDGSGGSSFFHYSYNGVTYKMRYVTVTATENSHLRKIDDVDLNKKLGPNNVIEIVGMSSSIVGLLSGTIIVGGLETCLVLFHTPVSISLLLLGLLPNYTPQSKDLIELTGSAVWTVKYIQIYDNDAEVWRLNAGVEYVTVQRHVDYDIYNANTELYDSYVVHYDNEIIYSSQYNNLDVMKERAVLAYEYGQGDNSYLDKVDKVTFEYGDEGKTVLTLNRTIYDYVDAE